MYLARLFDALACSLLFLGLAYCAVPLYKLYCSASGVSLVASSSVINTESTIAPRVLLVKFVADVDSSLSWKLSQNYHEFKLLEGETVLSFYSIVNESSTTAKGIATYSVVPSICSEFLNKVQCFCFEQQQIGPNESVDLPILFYIEPVFWSEPQLAHIKTVTIYYHFHKI